MGQWLFATPDGAMQEVSIDPQVGGRFRIVEKRGEYLAEHHGQYLELDRPRRIVFTFADTYIDAEAEGTRVTVDIEPVEGGCHVTLTHEMPEQYQSMEQQVECGWAGVLAGCSKTLGEEVLSLVIERTFNAPIQLVWDAWTQAEHLSNWICPADFTISSAGGDLAKYGVWHTVMHSPENTTHICRGQYLVIDEPHTLSFTHAWQNDIGGLGHMTTVVVSLKAVGDKTHMRFEQTGFRSAESRDQHEHGWTGAFDALESRLQTSRATS